MQMHANEYDTLKIINYIRSEVAAHRKPLLILQPATATAAEMRDSSSYPWLDDRYLSPALQDDEFLFHDWENDDIHGEPKRPCYSEGNDEERELVELQAATNNTGETLPEALLAEDADLAAAFADMQALALTDPALRGLLLSAAEAPTTTPTQQQQQQQQQWEMGSKPTPSSVDKEHPVSSSDTFDHTLISQSDTRHHQQPQPQQQPPREEEQQEVNDAADSARAAADAARAAAIDDAYFESYSFFDIHREMLGDRARTEAYQKALENNPSLIQNATLLDVGCGTGVLSMFAARGGASKAFAVDGSPVIAEYARKICAANRFGGGEEGPVVVLSEKAENLAALPGLPEGGKVDVLVSEWMGKHFVRIVFFCVFICVS
jgi:ribosomal protein L11 methylase PrmA